MDFRRLINQLVHRQGNKIAEHDVDHRAHAGHGSANANTGNASLGDRRIDHAFRAEFFHQSRKDFKRRPRLGDIFADDKYSRVSAHLFGQRFVDGLGEGDFSNGSVTGECWLFSLTLIPSP